ncbi:MAG: hypothetical protein K6E33_05575, partial [Lachnospiraceae bacterium]|nr:hypothetical protein [Lachnospiraceae bacterium]
LIADNLNQKLGGTTKLIPGADIAVNTTGVIYGLQTAGEADGSAHICKKDGAGLRIEGAFKKEKAAAAQKVGIGHMTEAASLAIAPDGSLKRNLDIGTYAAMTELFKTSLTNLQVNGEDFIMADNAEDSLYVTVVQDGDTVWVAKSMIRVTGDNGYDEMAATMKQAVDKITKNLPKTGAAYTISLSENTAMSSDLTIPAAVTALTLTTEATGAGYTQAGLDFLGHTLTYGGAGRVTVDGGLTLVSTADNKPGSLKVTNAKGAGLTLDGSGLSPVSGNAVILDDVNVTVAAPSFEIKGTEGTDYRVDGSISAVNMTATSGTLYVTTLTTAGNIANKDRLYIGTLNMNNKGIYTNEGTATVQNADKIFKLDNKKDAYFEAGSISMASNGGLYTEPGSILTILDNAALYNLCLGQDAQGAKALPSANAVIRRGGNAVITVNGTPKTADASDKLDICTIDGGALAPTPGQTILFRTNVKTFPTDLINLVQPEGEQPDGIDYTNYDRLMQIGSDVMVAARWFTLYEGEAEPFNKLGSFSKWSEMVSYINNVNHPSSEYTIVMTDNARTLENITMPAKTSKLTISGNGHQLSHLGSLVLASDTVLKDISLYSEAYNSKTSFYEVNNKATLNLNSKSLVLDDAAFWNQFASITGNGSSRMTLIAYSTDPRLTVTGAVGVLDLTMKNYELAANAVTVRGAARLTSRSEIITNAATAVTGDLTLEQSGITAGTNISVGKGTYMTSSSLDARGNIALKDLHSLNKGNTLSYAAAANNSLSITGVVDAGDAGEEDISVTVTGNGKQAEINKNAVSISVKYIENLDEKNIVGSDTGAVGGNAVIHTVSRILGTEGYVTKHYNYNKNTMKTTGINTDYALKDLVKSAKAPASFFVIDRDTDADTVSYITKKAGNALRVENAESFDVSLYEMSNASGNVIGYYGTLQEAFTDIDRYADKTKTYKVTLSANASRADDAADTKSNGKVTKDNTNLTFPANAKLVTIEPEDTAGDRAWIYMNNTMTLRCNVSMNKIQLVPNAKANTKIGTSLAGFTLYLTDTAVDTADGRGLGQIAGNGVNANNTSGLVIKDSDIVLSSNLNNVRTVGLDNTKLTVSGNTNIGRLEQTGSAPSEFEGLAAIKTTAMKVATTDAKGKKVMVVSGNRLDAVNPNITIAADVTSADPSKLTIGLKYPVKTGNVTVYKSLTSGDFIYSKEYGDGGYDSLAELVNGGTAYHILKGLNVDAGSFTYAPGAGGEVTDAKQIKNGGFICYSALKTPYTLYTADNKLAEFATFADAVAEINNRKAKTAEYTVAVDPATVSADKPEAFGMPGAANLAKLTIRPTGEAVSANLYYG